ncbi:hypothetical protein [uncultured Algibacter sp.]|uniref:hypothetical protein n=1 Tax=uncultured Algibacter sp. TaxID=298659 RepID=UPI0032180B40
MELQTAKQFFPILSGGEFYPMALGRILAVFYTSNQVEFTKEELQCATNLSEDEISNGLMSLTSLGEVVKTSKNTLSTPYFSLSTQGSINNLENNIEKSRGLLDSLEQNLDARDASNQALNNFIKETIIFYSEVLDFTELKVAEHFNTKRLK